MNIAASSPYAFSPHKLGETITLPIPNASRGRLAGTRGAVHRQEFAVGAYRMKGGRLREVLVGEKTRRGLQYVGSARPLSPRLRDHLFQLLRMLRVHTCCPFPSLEIAGRIPGQRVALSEHHVAESLWVEPNVTVCVEFDGWSTDGQLINPRVVGVR